MQGFLVPSLALLGLVGNSLAVLVLHSPGVDMKVVKISFLSVATFVCLFDIHYTRYS